MTEHTFDLAAALVDQAIERLDSRDYGITRILFHDFGQFPLNANHTHHDTGHTAKMWACDDQDLIPAAEANAPHIGGTPQGRIVNFRAGHLIFGVIDTDTAGETEFFARGARGYPLTATIGPREGGAGIAADPLQDSPDLHSALDYILPKLDHDPAA